MSLLKTGVFVSLAPRLCLTRARSLAGVVIITMRPLSQWVLVCVCVCILFACVCVRGCVRACTWPIIIYGRAGKTIMEKYLWSTSVAHQQMIIKPGAPRNPAPPTVATPPPPSPSDSSREPARSLRCCNCVFIIICVSAPPPQTRARRGGGGGGASAPSVRPSVRRSVENSDGHGVGRRAPGERPGHATMTQRRRFCFRFCS